MISFTRSTRMPHRRAVASLLPTASACTPNTVRASTSAASAASTNSSQTPGESSSHAGSGVLAISALRPCTGASTFCSPARYFASPRATPMLPSVTMNGTMRSRVMSRPLIAPSAPHAATPPSTALSVPAPSAQQHGAHHRRQRDRRADRQVDAAAHDHERHADRAHADDHGLRRDGLEVVRGQELARAASSANSAITSASATNGPSSASARLSIGRCPRGLVHDRDLGQSRRLRAPGRAGRGA